jgi:hypothetical protein
LFARSASVDFTQSLISCSSEVGVISILSALLRLGLGVSFIPSHLHVLSHPLTEEGQQCFWQMLLVGSTTTAMAEGF